MKFLQHFISRLTGIIAFSKPPQIIVYLWIKIFIWLYKVETVEIAKPLNEFASFGDFFIRDLKPRSLGVGVVSPCDGEILECGRVADGKLTQIKGMTYSVEELLEDQNIAQQFIHGEFITIYLSPRDYHNVHAPESGTITQVRRIGGTLWPVSKRFVKSVKDLYIQQERVCITFQADSGVVYSVIPVGALNVGSIAIHCKMGDRIEKGQKIATFRLGSTVVLLSSSAATDQSKLISGSFLRYGETLIF